MSRRWRRRRRPRRPRSRFPSPPCDAAAAAAIPGGRARAGAAAAQDQDQAGPRRPRTRPSRRTSAKKPTSQDFAALLNKLTATPKTPPNAKVGPRIVQGIGAANAMTADLADALKSQIYQCWSPPVGAPNANDLVVDFDLTLNPDGTSRRAPHSDCAGTCRGNPYTRAAAEAARRAIFQCQPYNLPAGPLQPMARNQSVALRSAPDDESMTPQKGPLREPGWTNVFGEWHEEAASDLRPVPGRARAAAGRRRAAGGCDPGQCPAAAHRHSRFDLRPIPAQAQAGANIAGVIRADLERSGLFKPIDPQAPLSITSPTSMSRPPSPIGG